MLHKNPINSCLSQSHLKPTEYPLKAAPSKRLERIFELQKLNCQILSFCFVFLTLIYIVIFWVLRAQWDQCDTQYLTFKPMGAFCGTLKIGVRPWIFVSKDPKYLFN